MIKLIIFDSDGVLVDARDIHFKALNMALSDIDPKYVISQEEHFKIFDGLPTRKKLDILVSKYDLPVDCCDLVYENKQKYTSDLLESSCDLLESSVVHSEILRYLFYSLKISQFKIAVATNSIKSTIVKILKSLGVFDCVDFCYSNEDVTLSKPSSEMFLRCMLDAGVDPAETLIIEDSPVGREAVYRSGAHLMPIDNIGQVNIVNIQNKIGEIEKAKSADQWVSDELNIIIPMSGEGTRFGSDCPKPLIDAAGKPILQWAVESLNIKGKYVFVVRNSHVLKYPYMLHFLNLISEKPEVVYSYVLTEGAACTTLLAEELINNDKPLLIVNSDQYIEWDSSHFMHTLNSRSSVDGAILTFKSDNPKWSYARVENDRVVEVAEKKVISDNATVGIYWWRKGSDYVKYAKRMIEKNIRTNNEFYVCPVFNQAIEDGKHIIKYDVDRMLGLGTPEDVERFSSEINIT